MESCQYNSSIEIFPVNLPRKLIKNYAINQRGEMGETWLHIVLYHNCTDISVYNTLNCGCRVNVPNFHGMMPLHFSVRRPTNIATRMIIANYADINAKDIYGNTPLHYAAFYSRLANVEELLLQRHIAYDLKNFGDMSPLYYAITAIHSYPITTALLRRGCNLNLRNTALRQTVLHRAVKANAENNIVHLLIRNGADIHAQDIFGMTPLHYAVSFNNVEVVCMILYYGANANQKSNDGRTPLELAITEEKRDIAAYLMLYTDDFNDRNDIGWTLFHITISHFPQLALRMLENGADVNLTSNGYDCASLILDDGYEMCDLFETIWKRMDVMSWIRNRNNDRPHSYKSILEIISHNTNFPDEQFFRYLYMIFESPHIDEIIEHHFDVHTDNCLLLQHIFERCVVMY